MTHPHDDPDPATSADGGRGTVLQMSPRDAVLVGAALTVLGAGLGRAFPAVAGWARDTDRVPVPGVVRLLDSFAHDVGPWLLPVAGAAAGLVLGLVVVHQETRLHVTARDVTFVKGGTRRRFSRAQVTVAVLDGKHLVLRDDRDADLVREELDLPRDEVVAALRHHGWPVGD